MSTRIEKRKLLLLVPVPVLLCSALFFYALGGGRKGSDGLAVGMGLNSRLPDAKLPVDTAQSKMQVYEKSAKDSAKRDDGALRSVADKLGFVGEDPQTKAINDKLTQLNRIVSQPAESRAAPAVSGTDVSRLETMMQTISKKRSGPDPELAQLNAMMSKIMQIQNPELVRRRLKEQEARAVPDSTFRAVPAVISRKQKVVEGAVVELRLSDSMRLGRLTVPKGYLVYGLASFANQRLHVAIRNIRLGTSIIPVKITVFDRRDGMPGINAPEAELSSAVAAGVTDASGSIGITGFDLTSQLAGAGIEAAKGLLRKKVKKIRQKLPEGYPLLLRNETNGLPKLER